ncbi:MAG: putative lipid II flippase FtsW [Proteobacteria bacterium]|nr:putative lipid II flippase FtsW [Pseudomonadota bacterium]
MVLGRADDSLLAHWWWTVDRWLMLAILLLLALGFLLMLAASMPVAERLGLDNFHFVKRQLAFLVISFGTMITISIMSEQNARRLSLLLLPAAFVLLVLTLTIGPEIKGANRWLQIGNFTLQPSEFLKPAFVVASAWLLAGSFEDQKFPGRQIAVALFVVVITALLLQPDVGQSVLISGVFLGQLLLAGLPIGWLALLGLGSVAGLAVAYTAIPHVQRRIDIFFDPASGDTYQIDTALNAFRTGGLFGTGPGEGLVKRVLPDAHTDYIFAVAGEEFGALACLVILGLFAVIVIRGLARLLDEEDVFTLLAVSGLLSLFGLQALINMGVNLGVLPSKGMTLPFISYGGSSLLALAITMGLVLALTRRKPRSQRLPTTQDRPSR